MHLPARSTAATAVLIVILSGCNGSGDGAACTYDTTFEGISVSGAAGSEPTIAFTPGAVPATELGVLDLCPGSGDAATGSSIVTADYIGVAQSTGETFDSSYARGEPITFAASQVIPGWEQGLEGMEEGGTRLLVIPPELGYGEVSPGPGIGDSETLIFVIDLIDVQ